MSMSEQERLEIEAATFRKLLNHLDEHKDVQNIDLQKKIVSPTAPPGCALAAFTSLDQNVFLSATGATSFKRNISTPETQIQKMFITVRRKLMLPHQIQSEIDHSLVLDSVPLDLIAKLKSMKQ